MQGQPQLRLPKALLALGAIIATAAYGAPGDEQLQHQQEQLKARQQKLMPQTPDVRLSEPAPSLSSSFPDEKPCFAIKRVSLSGQQALPH